MTVDSSGQSSAEKTLAHYGVKGMKWGVRRRSSSSSSSLSEDAAQARALLSKPGSSASNADIQAAINRMRLESQFKELQLQTIPQSRMARAATFVRGLVADNATQQVQRVASAASAIAVEQALQKGGVGNINFDKQFAKDVGTRIVPKKKGK